MLRRRSAAKGQDGKDGGDDKHGRKADGKEHLQFDCKKCGTANDVAVVRVRACLPLRCAKFLHLLVKIRMGTSNPLGLQHTTVVVHVFIAQ